MNLLTDPDFELGNGWVYTGGASRTLDPPPYSGLYSGRLYARWGTSVQNVHSRISQDVLVIPGIPTPIAFFVNFDGLPDAPVEAPSFSTLTVLWDPGDGLGYQIAGTFAKADVPIGWNRVELSLPTPVGPSAAVRFSLGELPEFTGGLLSLDGFCQIDATELGDEEAHLMRSTALPFMERLKGLIEAIDPNIGKIYVTPKRWPTIERLEREGTLRIQEAGAMDDVTRVGQDVTRFWWMRPAKSGSRRARFLSVKPAN